MKQHFLPILYSSLGAAIALIAVELAPQIIGAANASPAAQGKEKPAQVARAQTSHCRFSYSYGFDINDPAAMARAKSEDTSHIEASNRNNNDAVASQSANLISQGYEVVAAAPVISGGSIGAWAMLCRN